MHAVIFAENKKPALQAGCAVSRKDHGIASVEQCFFQSLFSDSADNKKQGDR